MPLFVPQRVRVCFFCKLFLLSSSTKYILWFLFLSCYCLAWGLVFFKDLFLKENCFLCQIPFSPFIWSVFVLSFLGMSHLQFWSSDFLFPKNGYKLVLAANAWSIAHHDYSVLAIHLWMNFWDTTGRRLFLCGSQVIQVCTVNSEGFFKKIIIPV